MNDLALPAVEDVVLACRRAEAARRTAVHDPLPLPAPLTQGPELLRVVVLLPRTDVGGGARILVEHANRLADRGHEVTLLGHGAAPDWAGLRAPYRRVPWGLDLVDAVPDADAVVAGYWDQVRAARAATGLPVLHLEQGDAHLYEDVPAELEQEARRCLQAASATLTLSGAAQGLLRDRYGVAASVVPNALDRSVFTVDAVVPASSPSRPYLVSVGWDGNAFKGLDVVRAVWERLRERGHDLDLVRISPSPAREDWGTVVVRPPQVELAGLLRGALVYLGASRYETFPLPPLEAMGCGTPVVSTANVGVLEYAEDGRDALLRPVDDVDGLTDAVEQVLTDPALAARLREGGLATAARYDWARVVDTVEAQLRALVLPAPVLDAAWRLDLPDLVDPSDARRLRRLLATTRAREVQVPLLHALPADGEVARWTTVARRRKGVGVARLHAPARTVAPYPGSARLAALSADPGAAVRALVVDVERARGTDAAEAVRWLVLALLQAGDGQAALPLGLSALASFPDHADLASLAAVAAALTGRAAEAEQLAGVAEEVGSGARYDEWFTRLPL